MGRRRDSERNRTAGALNPAPEGGAVGMVTACPVNPETGGGLISPESRADGRASLGPRGAGHYAIPLLFGLTLFVSATLLFSLQPMVGKMLLPRLGGTPAVWNTCMVFFQALLLVGYAYAHGSCAWLGVRRQAAVHLAVLLLPAAVLPIALAPGQNPPADANPVPWLLWQLLLGVGAPFALLSTTAPLLQRWFAETGHAEARDPYFLYAASNAGSLLALLAYPVLIERVLGLTQQSRVWAVGYGGLVALAICCAGVVLWTTRGRRGSAILADGRAETARGGAGDESASEMADGDVGVAASSPERRKRRAAAKRAEEAGTDDPANIGSRADAPTTARRLWWIFLAFVPSSLMLGVTTYITTDIAAVPLLWVLPLALYLLTFVLVFARHEIIPLRPTAAVLPFLIVALLMLIGYNPGAGFWVQIGLHLIVLFAAALVCHGRLAASRPAARYLTEFYFWMSVGGVLGGIFNAIIAPLVFNTVAEYPLALALCCFALTGRMADRREPTTLYLDVLLPIGVGTLALIISQIPRLANLGIIVPLALCLAFRKRPVRLGLALSAVITILILSASQNAATMYISRNFYGVKRIRQEPNTSFRQFVQGGTTHGCQFTDPLRRGAPLAYYHATGPVGDVFRIFNPARPTARVAAIGLGVGSVAAYAQPGQRFTFYEIDPAVADLAKNPWYFTFLNDCKGKQDIVLGDGRLTLSRSKDGEYDLILLDAFNSDAIPTHLLTVEAMQLYLAKLAPGGWLVFHATNGALEIHPVLANLAAHAGLQCWHRHDRNEEKLPGKQESEYVVMARSKADLLTLPTTANWAELPPRPEFAVWTDQYSNILSLMRWR